MTLKEKMMEIHPGRASDRYYGGVCGCPFDYPKLNAVKKVCDSGYEYCEECWNQEYLEAEDTE